MSLPEHPSLAPLADAEPPVFGAHDSTSTPEPELSAPGLVAPAMAEQRLTDALRELHVRGEALVEDAEAIAQPGARVIAIGVVSALLFGGVAFALGRRRARRGRAERGVAARLAVELVREVTTRVLVTAATHVMDELVVPLLRERLAANRSAPKRARKALI